MRCFLDVCIIYILFICMFWEEIAKVFFRNKRGDICLEIVVLGQ